jgi:hypothetical protein
VLSWGEVGRVSIHPIGEAITRVVVDTEKRYKLQVTGTDEEEFFQALFLGIENQSRESS